MKPSSPNTRLDIPSPPAVAAAPVTIHPSSPAPADGHDPPRPAALPDPVPSQVPIRPPQTPRVKSVGGAQQEIASALRVGSFKRVHSALQQAADGRRLDAVLRAPGEDNAPAAYVDLVDQTLANLQGPDTARLVRRFGADLLNATVEHGDLPRFTQCCEQLNHVLPSLASMHSGRLMRAAARDPHALSILLEHLAPQHWGELLHANGGEAMACLWRHAVGEPIAVAVQPEVRALAFRMLTDVFTHVSVLMLNRVHHETSVQRHVHAALRNFPEELKTLGAVLTDRGGTVPWGGT